jgi:PAS domain S-box-containing protein
MANKQCAELVGYASPDELLGKSRFDLVGAIEGEATTAERSGLSRPASFRNREHWIRDRDGVRIPVEVDESFVEDSHGEPTGLVLILRDISGRKRLEAQYRAVFEATGDGLVIYTMDGVMVEANPAFCAMNGYSCEELVGNNVAMLVHPDLQGLLGEFIDTIGSGGSLHARATNVRKDGTTFPVDVHGTVFQYESAPHILGVARDVTEQVEAHELLEQRVAERTTELETVLEVSHNVASVLELEPLLNLILEQLLVVTEYSWAAVLGLEGNRLVRLAGSGDGGAVPGHYSFALGDPGVGLAWEPLRKGECLIADDLADEEPLARTYRQLFVEHPEMPPAGGARSWLLVPLMFQGRTIGAISLLHPQPGAYTQHHAQLVRAIADQAAVAIENARLYEQAQQAAALEERQRLARELHDAVTQTLFSASLIAEVLPRLWKRDPEAGRKRLEDVRALTRGALAEMRTLLLELRPTAIVEAELGELLRQLGDVLTGRGRLSVRVTAEGEARLPADVQLALYRIAQEALNNIDKHARASQVEVSLVCGANNVRLRIKDDGCGFDVRAKRDARLAHFGMTGMRDRAKAVGAAFSMHSRPGQGTEVRVRWRGGQGGSET